MVAGRRQKKMPSIDRTSTTPAAFYLPDDVYLRITNELAELPTLAAAPADFDAQLWAVQFMGRVCGVWPETAREAKEATAL
jgi:hypothetical protein